MAKGSHKTWGGWETRTCWHCHQRITLNRGAASHHNPTGGRPFSICQQCFGTYSAAWAYHEGRTNEPQLP